MSSLEIIPCTGITGGFKSLGYWFQVENAGELKTSTVSKNAPS